MPPALTLYKYFAAANITNGWLFYFAHRLFHSKALYRFHKQHHMYRGTVGVAAEHAHPLEQILANQVQPIDATQPIGATHAANARSRMSTHSQ